MTFRCHQIPATITLFSAEKATGLEGRTHAPAAERVQGRTLALCQPGVQLLLFFIGRGLELIVSGHFLRPLCPAGLAIGIDQRAIDSTDHRFAILHAKALKHDALGDFRMIHRQRDRDHLAAIQLPFAAGQQNSLSIYHHRHGRPGFHPLAQWRAGGQRYQQCLRRPRWQVDAADQNLAVTALDLHVERDRPVHRTLQAQAHDPGLRPVPGTGLRRQAQARLRHRVERHPTQHFTLGCLLRIGLRQAGILRRHLDDVGGSNKVEQRLLPGGCREQRRGKHQGKNSG
ncbi:hypothetical protein D3C78_711960 [compost metagenome]